MRILFLARLFYPHIGGVEKHVLQLSQALKKEGHKVIVVTELFDQKLKKYEKYQGIEIFRIPVGKAGWTKKFIVWKWLWEHRELIDQVDVIHAHDVFFWLVPFRIILFKKIFTTFHGYEGYPLKKKNIMVHRLSALLSAGTLSVGKYLDIWYGITSDHIIYGAVDAISTKGKTNPHSAVFIGRLDEQTGILTYYEAFKAIKKKIPLFRFTVVGQGVYKKQLSSARVVGSKKNPYMFFNTHRFAFVSRYLAILEAFAARRLVFAVYDNPLKKDYLLRSPLAKFMIIAETPEELTAKVLQIIKNPALEKKLTEKAHSYVQKLNWDAMAKLYLKLWKR